MQSCTGEWKVNRGVHKWKAKAGIFRLSATPNCKTHETVYSSLCAPVKPTLLLHLLQGTSKSQVHTGTSKHAWPPESAWRSVQRGSGKAPVQSCCYSGLGSVEVQCVAWTLVFCFVGCCSSLLQVLSGSVKEHCAALLKCIKYTIVGLKV
jgi:hypothetical protein